MNCRLAEVGVLEKPRDHGKSYETGQVMQSKTFIIQTKIIFSTHLLLCYLH